MNKANAFLAICTLLLAGVQAHAGDRAKASKAVASQQGVATETLEIAHEGFLDEPSTARKPRRGATVVMYNYMPAWPAAPIKPQKSESVTLK